MIKNKTCDFCDMKQEHIHGVIPTSPKSLNKMKTKLLIEMTPEMKERLRKLAKKNSMSMGTYIRQLILKQVK
jgi:hypothetical protein